MKCFDDVYIISSATWLVGKILSIEGVHHHERRVSRDTTTDCDTATGSLTDRVLRELPVAHGLGEEHGLRVQFYA